MRTIAPKQPIWRATQLSRFSVDALKGLSPLDVEKELLKIKRKIGKHYTQGQYPEALESALDLQMKIEELIGRDNVMYGSALNNVALMCKMTLDFERSIETYTEALQVYDDIVGRRHPSYMVTLSNLGAAYRAFASTKKGMEKQQLLERASEALHDAHDFHNEILGDDHKETLMSANHIASLLKTMKKFDEAEKMYEKTLELCKRRHGEWDSLTATTLNNLGMLLKQVERYQGALVHYENAFLIRSKTLGEKHPDTIVTMHNIAELYFARGDIDEANQMQEKIIAAVGDKDLENKIEKQLAADKQEEVVNENDSINEDVAGPETKPKYTEWVPN